VKLRANQLAQHLQSGAQPVYLLTSDEPLCLEESAARIRDHLRTQGAERQAAQADGHFNWRDWAGGFSGLSLFSSLTLAEVRLPTGKPGVEGGKVLEAWGKQPPPDTILLLLLPRADKAMQNSKWFAALESAGAWLAPNPPNPGELPDWIGERLSRHGLRADRDTLEWLAERVEGNLLAAHQEIEKLALLLPAGAVSRETVRAAVTDVSRFDAADLPEAIWRGDSARVTRVCEHLHDEGESPLLALWLLTQDVRTLLNLADGISRGNALPQLMRTQRVWEARQGLFERALRRLDAGRLRQALRRCGEVDRLAKGVGTDADMDAWRGLRQLSLGLSGRGGLSRPAWA
jgi:DNA polymerase-3 subunit delta